VQGKTNPSTVNEKKSPRLSTKRAQNFGEGDKAGQRKTEKRKKRCTTGPSLKSPNGIRPVQETEHAIKEKRNLAVPGEGEKGGAWS